MDNVKRQTAKEEIRIEWPQRKRQIIIRRKSPMSTIIAHIFQFLDPVDLVNIVDTSKRFKNPAKDTKYKEEYKSDEGWFFPNRLSGLKIAFEFLHCFGHLLLGLCISCGGLLPRHNDTILKYVNKYCANQLAMLFVSSAKLKVSNFKKPFSKVETLYLCEFK